MSYITISPVCMSCGMSVGHVYGLYKMIYDKRIEEYINETGYKVTDPSTIQKVAMGDFLNKVVDKSRLCCRQSILGHISIVQDSV